MATAAASPMMICDAANGTQAREDMAMNFAFRLSFTSKKQSRAFASNVHGFLAPP
jgi:hypothetical protein